MHDDEELNANSVIQLYIWINSTNLTMFMADFRRPSDWLVILSRSMTWDMATNTDILILLQNIDF